MLTYSMIYLLQFCCLNVEELFPVLGFNGIHVTYAGWPTSNAKCFGMNQSEILCLLILAHLYESFFCIHSLTLWLTMSIPIALMTLGEPYMSEI